MKRMRSLLVAICLLVLAWASTSCSRNTQPGGGENAPVTSGGGPISWPAPLPPGAKSMTFHGEGNGTTEEFTLEGDGALRIDAKKGPFKLRVRRADGRFLKDVADLPDGGQALMAIPKAGRYSLVIEARGRWGVTVVY